VRTAPTVVEFAGWLARQQLMLSWRAVEPIDETDASRWLESQLRGIRLSGWQRTVLARAIYTGAPGVASPVGDVGQYVRDAYRRLVSYAPGVTTRREDGRS